SQAGLSRLGRGDLDGRGGGVLRHRGGVGQGLGLVGRPDAVKSVGAGAHQGDGRQGEERGAAASGEAAAAVIVRVVPDVHFFLRKLRGIVVRVTRRGHRRLVIFTGRNYDARRVMIRFAA